MNSTPQTLARRTAVGLLLFYWPAMFVATHWPKLDLGSAHSWFSNDKILHALAYGSLALLLGIAVGLGTREVPVSRQALLVVLLTILVGLYGIGDELTQPFVGRTADVHDWIADMIGCAVGLTAALLVNGMLAVREPSGEVLQGERSA